MQYAEKTRSVIIPTWEQNVHYVIGMCVKHGDALWYCTGEHTSGANFNDAYWESVGGGGSGGVPKLIELVKNVQILSGQTLSLDLDAGTNKFDIRTCYFAADKQGNLQVKMYDKAVDGFCVYSSNAEYPIYDIVCVPYEDKDATSALHVVLTNLTGVDINGTLRIKLTSLS